jgi:transcription factor STE12
MDHSPFVSLSSSGSAVPRASHPYTEDYAYPSHEHHQQQRYASAFHLQGQLDPNSRLTIPSALQISTDTAAAQDHDADEQTAHPSRMQSQLQRIDTPALQALAETDAQPAGSTSRRSSPSDAGSSPALTSFGNFEDSLSRPLTHKERELLAHLDRLKFFLATAPSRWTADGNERSSGDPNALPVGHPNSAHPALNRFLLPNSEYVSCVLWGGLYHITGTDIVRALVFRFEAFGRPVKNMKKFEEGVFSDLRNLKPGVDACLEEPKVCADASDDGDPLPRRFFHFFADMKITPLRSLRSWIYCSSIKAFERRRNRKCSTGKPTSPHHPCAPVP